MLRARCHPWVCAVVWIKPAMTRLQTTQPPGKHLLHPVLVESRRLPERPAGAAGGAAAAQPPGRGAGRRRLGVGRQELQAGFKNPRCTKRPPCSCGCRQRRVALAAQ